MISFKKIAILALALVFLNNMVLCEPIVLNGTYSGSTIEESEAVSDDYFKDAVFIGDSLTVSIESRNLFPDTEFIAEIGTSILGASKDTIFPYKGGKKKLSELLEIYAPEKIYILIGTNTLCFAMSEDAINHYNALLDTIITARPNSLVYILTVPTLREFTLKKYKGASNKRFIAFNKRLLDLAQERHAYYLDIAALFYTSDKQVQPKKEYVTGDGLHLSMEGAQLLKDYLSKHTVKELLVNDGE